MTDVIKQIVRPGEYGTQTIKMIVHPNERGPKGEKGDPGVQGPQGIPGPRGYDGAIHYRAGTGIKISDENIIYATGGSIAEWGGIQGDIQSQTDLQNALNAKQDVMADFTGANGVVGGTSGKVPAPAATDNVKYLKGDGTWSEVDVEIDPPVNIGEVISEPTSVAYVDTANIVDEAVTAAKIDLSTLGGNYSTSEVDTGYTWINGAHIYKKTVDCGSLPNNTSKDIAHNITNMAQVVRIEGVSYRSSDGIWFQIGNVPNASVGIETSINVNVNTTNIVLITGNDRTNMTAYVTLYYTKTL